MSKAQRQAAESRGQRGEWLAAWYLRAKGYRVLAQRFRSAAGEIDLVARRGRNLVFVEVKTHGSLATAREAITPKQQQRITRAAEIYLQQHPKLSRLEVRFDAILLAPKTWPHHVHDAWRPTG